MGIEVGLVPLIALALIVVPGMVLANRMPHPMAVHWGADGAPNGSGYSILRTTVPLWVVGMVILAIGVFARARAQDTNVDPRLVSVGMTAGAFFIFALDAGIGLATNQANLDVPDWTQARPFASLLPVFAAAVVAACLGAALAFLQGHGPDRAADPGA